MGSKTSPSYATFLNTLLLLATVVLLLLGYVGAVTWLGVAVSSGVLLLVILVLGYAQVLAWVGMTEGSTIPREGRFGIGCRCS
jgi:hypothetical protein